MPIRLPHQELLDFIACLKQEFSNNNSGPWCNELLAVHNLQVRRVDDDVAQIVGRCGGGDLQSVMKYFHDYHRLCEHIFLLLHHHHLHQLLT